MANVKITLPTKRGGVLKEVSSFPSGIINDGVFGHEYGGKKYVRTRNGIATASEAGIFADGTDQTARINYVYSLAKVKTILFDYDGDASVVIAGTVTIPAGKYVKIRPGTMLSTTGAGVVNGGIYDFDNCSQVFAGTQNFNPENFAHGFIPASAWGFFPDTGVNMTPKLQLAVNWGIASTKTKLVLITIGGEYKVHNLIIAKYDGGVNGGGEARQASINIMGAANSMSQGVTFLNDNVDAATIHMQVVYGCNIENITFQGIGPDVADYEQADDAEWRVATNGQLIRINRKSPGQTALSIDNFRKIGVFNSFIDSPADYYPGLDNWYTTTQHSGSTNINVINCNFSRMYVGLAQGLSGAPNGEGIHIKGGFGIYVAYTWVSGQLQSRENTISDYYHIMGKVFVSNHLWGTGIGDIPTVNNCNINYLKYISLTAGNFTIPRFNGGYSEGIYSIGCHYGSTPVVFDRWVFAVKNIGPGTTGMAPVLLEAKTASVTFTSCNLYGATYYSAFPFNVRSLTLDNCRIEGGLVLNMNQYSFIDNVRYEGVSNWGAMGNNIRLDEDRNEVVLNEGTFYNSDEMYLFPGCKLKGVDNRIHERIGDKFDKIEINPYSQYKDAGNVITIDAAQQTLSFPSINDGLFKTNDVIYTDTIVDNPLDQQEPACAVLGYVISVVGGVVTLSGIPAGLTNGGTYRMYIIRIPKYIARAIGDITAGSTTINNIQCEPASFVTGDRIKGNGITPGTYVVSGSAAGGSIQISSPATLNASRVELYDARMKVTAEDNFFYYVGGYSYHYDNLGIVWFKGDELLPGSRGDGRVCIVPGKVGTGLLPYWISRQNYYTNEAGTGYIGENTYFDGANWIYKKNGPATLIYFQAGGMQIFGAPSGTAGAIAPIKELMNINQSSGLLLGGVPGNTEGVLKIDASNNITRIPVPSGGGGGDVYLANDNVFTGENKFVSNELNSLQVESDAIGARITVNSINAAPDSGFTIKENGTDRWSIVASNGGVLHFYNHATYTPAFTVEPGDNKVRWYGPFKLDYLSGGGGTSLMTIDDGGNVSAIPMISTSYPVVEVSGTTVTGLVKRKFIFTNAAQSSITLPTTAAFGEDFIVVSAGCIVQITQSGDASSGQRIYSNGQATTRGSAGSMSLQIDSACRLVCTRASGEDGTEWRVESLQGTISAV